MKRLDAVIASGIGFLRRTLGTEAAELWRDFALPGVSAGSTEWVSAFMAAQIGSIPEGRSLAASVVQTIASRARATGGWGYRQDVPEDCDSTAWVLRAALAAGVDLPDSTVARALQFILEHQRRDGGFVTFGADAELLLRTVDRAGWFEPEVSVTSAAAMALVEAGHVMADPVHRACIYVFRHRHGEVWNSYWWNGFGYATYHAIEALSKLGNPRNAEPIATAGRAILRMRSSMGGWANDLGTPDNGFSTSFALRTLLLIDRSRACCDSLMQSLQFLAGLHTSTGMFLPSTEMLAPGGAKGLNLVLRDNGSVTTACAVRAFHEVRSRLRECEF